MILPYIKGNWQLLSWRGPGVIEHVHHLTATSLTKVLMCLYCLDTTKMMVWKEFLNPVHE